MGNTLRCLLVSMALLAAAGSASAGKVNPPAHKPPAPKPPPVHRPPVHRPPPPRLPVPRPIHGARPLPLPKVSHHPRPIVHRGPVRHMRPTATRIVRQPVRLATIRTIHRYPVRRVPFRFVRRHRYYGYYGAYGYANYHFRGRYWWRTNYNHRHGALRRRGPRVVGGIVESVQGIPGNGMLVLRVFRPRSSRFR